MPTMLTTAQVANKLGVNHARVRVLALRMGGKKVGRDWVFDAGEVAAFSRRKRNPGRPRQLKKI